MYFFGRIADQTNEDKGFVYVSQRWLTSVFPPMSQVLNDIVLPNFGGVAEDYSGYDLPNDWEEAIRISKGDSFELVWDNNEVIMVSMAPQDDKPILKIELVDNKNLLQADGTDSCTVNFSLQNNNEEVVDITVDILAPVKTPTGATKLLKCSFVSGLCSKTFRTNDSGVWQIPSSDPSNFRFFDKPITIQSYYDGELM